MKNINTGPGRTLNEGILIIALGYCDISILLPLYPRGGIPHHDAALYTVLRVQNADREQAIPPLALLMNQSCGTLEGNLEHVHSYKPSHEQSVIAATTGMHFYLSDNWTTGDTSQRM